MRSRSAIVVGTILTAVAAGPGLAVPPPAGTVDWRASATTTIEFGGDLGSVYSPRSVLISPGQSVTWLGDFGAHPLAPAQTGSPIPTQDSGTSSVTASFSTPSSYSYICQLHSGAGMTGTVHVRGLPTAALTASANPVAGSAITLSAAASDEINGAIVGYRWDLNGDSVFELDGAGVPTQSIVRTEGSHRVGVQVRDSDGRTANATLDLAVAAAPATPQPTQQQPITPVQQPSQPTPQPVAPTDTKPPGLQVTAGPRAVRSLRAGTGLPVVVRSDEAVTATITLRLGASALDQERRSLRLLTRTRLSLRPTKARLARLRTTTSGALVVVVRAVDGAGNVAIRRLTISLG